jgi:hypothetical protein
MRQLRRPDRRIRPSLQAEARDFHVSGNQFAGRRTARSLTPSLIPRPPDLRNASLCTAAEVCSVHWTVWRRKKERWRKQVPQGIER